MAIENKDMTIDIIVETRDYGTLTTECVGKNMDGRLGVIYKAQCLSASIVENGFVNIQFEKPSQNLHIYIPSHQIKRVSFKTLRTEPWFK